MGIQSNAIKIRYGIGEKRKKSEYPIDNEVSVRADRETER